MFKLDLTKTAKEIWKTVDKHSPEILTGLGVAGMITTTILAVKATPKALELIELEKARINLENLNKAEELGHDSYEQVSTLPAIDVFRTTWKCYIPALVSGVSSIACIIGASSVHHKRNAALATAYKLSEKALVEYKDKVLEVVGDKKEQTIKNKVAEEQLKSNPISTKEIIITDNGNTLCYDSISGRYFKSGMEQIKKAENVINKQLINEMYISLNEFYYEIGLEPTKIGEQLGWNMDDGLIDIDFSSQIAEDGSPCLVINYRVSPKYDFYHIG